MAGKSEDEAEMGMIATLAKRALIAAYVHGLITAETLDDAFERWPRLRSA